MGSDQIIPVVGQSSPAASTLQQNSTTRRAFFRSFFLNHYPVSFWRKFVSELVSTFLLVFMTCGAAAISSTDEKRVSQLGASIVGGLIVTVMIYAVGHISGAHMNPAVTLAFATFRHFPFKHVPFYWVAQVTGATVSAFTLRLLLHPIKLIGTTSPSGTAAQALVAEIVVTFNMMFVTLAVATDNIGSDNAPGAVGELAGLAVGSAVCITSIFAGPISGGSMNPARTIGPAIASSYYEAIWVYLVGPVTGTLLAGCVYTFIRLNPRPGPTPSNPLRLRSIKSFSNYHQNQNSIPMNE